MDSSVVTVSDAGIPQKHDEIEIENEESSPSAARQEVNKPTDETVDLDKTVEMESVINKSKADLLSTSPKKSLKRNVSFPAESPVTGCLDPPDPWKNVPNWKTEDLLRAYKLGCEKHGTKPLGKIVTQLNSILNEGERYDILSLKGEKLDIKQCESLEEIFRHVRFRCLDLEATHLDDETSVAIFDMVEYYESACKLNISFNKNIGPRGWQACSKLIRKTPCLTFIDAKNCDLNERVMPILGRSLRMGCYLTRLHLQGVGLAGRALVILVAALKMNETLKELFIGDNKLMSTDGVQIGNLLKFNHKLELLDLRNNHLQDVGVHHVCDGLSEQTYGSGLLTLVLWNNQISFQAMSDISQALIKTESLETLNLGHNPITNEGIHLVKDGLLKSKSLLKLGLSGTKVTCEGAVALAEVIADTARLVRLDLQENDIKTAGLMALSLALKVNQSLSRLELDLDTKKEQGIKDYAEQQKRLQQDIKTYLDRNRDLAHKQLKEQEALNRAGEKDDENKDKVKLKEDVGENRGESECQNVKKSGDEHVYIPSVDKISRPKLLFLYERSPESDLESPACVPDNIPLLKTLEQPEIMSLTLPTSSGQDLLSPQFCPKIKAKKLFSVTRVTSPTLVPPTNPLLDQIDSSLPISHICTPISSMPVSSPQFPSLTIETLNLDTSSQIEVNSCFIQQKLEVETLATYIQEIVNADNSSSNLNIKKIETHNDLLGSIQSDTDEVFEETVDTCTLTAELSSDGRGDVSDERSLSAGDGPIGGEQKETGADETDILGTEHVSHKADDRSLCNKNNSASGSVGSNSEISLDSSELAKVDPNFEIKDNKCLSTSVGDKKLTSEHKIWANSVSVTEMGNISQGDSLSNSGKSHTSPEIERVQEKPKGDSDTHCVPVSLTSNVSDDQLDSIEIIPESDVSEIKFGSDINEEPAELLDCDASDDIASNAYLGLTDSLCDLVLPLYPENCYKTEQDGGNNSAETEIQSKNVKTLTGPLNSKTNGHKDSGIGETDSEQWNTVEKSDICDKVSDQENNSDVINSTNKPDFHTSLSLNGLKQELASLIDEDGNLTKGGTQTVLKSPFCPEDVFPLLVTKDDENHMEKSDTISDAHANGR